KFRSAESYLGNSPQAKRNQRANLTPGNTWQKRRTKELRIDCYWSFGDLEDKQMTYEEFENERGADNVPKRELKHEKYIDNWWDNLEIEVKEDIIKQILSWQTPKWKTRYFKRMNKYLEKKLAVLYKE
ncbi:unnamed protein product, partial [marine sediment metagenome]